MTLSFIDDFNLLDSTTIDVLIRLWFRIRVVISDKRIVPVLSTSGLDKSNETDLQNFHETCATRITYLWQLILHRMRN